MTINPLIRVRASEEVAEHGSVGAAITAIERQLSEEECGSEERRFMRKVRNYLLNAANAAFYAQPKGEK